MTLLARITLAASLSLPTCEAQKKLQSDLTQANEKVAALHAEKQQLDQALMAGLRSRPPASKPGQVSAAQYAKDLQNQLSGLKTQAETLQQNLSQTQSRLLEAQRQLEWARAQASSIPTPNAR
jgi:chromosome segregation ATPase